MYVTLPLSDSKERRISKQPHCLNNDDLSVTIRWDIM